MLGVEVFALVFGKRDKVNHKTPWKLGPYFGAQLNGFVTVFSMVGFDLAIIRSASHWESVLYCRNLPTRTILTAGTAKLRPTMNMTHFSTRGCARLVLGE